MPGQLAASSVTTLTAPFIPPANYREFLAFDPRYVTKFLKSRRCPQEVFSDFEQSLHAHLMSIGPTGAARGHEDKLSEYAPHLRGNATTVEAWADWLNMLLAREYGKLIKRNNRGGVRGDHVVSISGGSGGALEANTALDGHDRDRLLDRGHQGLTTRVFVSTFLDYVREEGGESLYRFAQNLMVYDNMVEVAQAMGITTTKAFSFRTKLREIGQRFNRGC